MLINLFFHVSVALRLNYKIKIILRTICTKILITYVKYYNEKDLYKS